VVTGVYRDLARKAAASWSFEWLGERRHGAVGECCSSLGVTMCLGAWCQGRAVTIGKARWR